MHHTPFKLVRAGRRTAWIYREQGQYLVDLDAQNICGEFDYLESAMEAARLKLATDSKAIFFICDAEGKVGGKVIDEIVQKRKRAIENAVAKILVGLISLLSCVTYVQFLGFQLAPTPLYYVFATLVSACIISCVLWFPWESKILLILSVTPLVILGYHWRKH